MNIRLLSDLHFEFHKDGGRAFVNSLNFDGVDVLVLAGDIDAVTIDLSLGLFAKAFTGPVLFVAGNHEFYGFDRERTLARIHDAALNHSNLCFLDHEIVTIKGCRFLGTPLWFSFSEHSSDMQQGWSDFRAIQGFGSWFHSENRKAVRFLQQELQPGDVVVTHYLPSHRCVHPKYKNNPYNCFFVSPCDELIESRKPALWMHGHTHESIDFEWNYQTLGAEGMESSTRIVCNPFGYLGQEENERFDPNFTVTL